MSKYLEIEKILLKQGKFHISLGLERIEKILSLLNYPQNSLKIIHVAGTNGKGSTCAIINQILVESGYKVGLYTSPHLIKYNERIKINNLPINDEDFYELVISISDLAEKNNIRLTEFEILTAVMFKYFCDEKVDFAVIEVGLGGRFDATNIIKMPLISVITSISKDHTERLGNTVDKISFEKGGIIKKNCPVIIDKDNQGIKVITEIAEKNNSKIYYPNLSKIILKDNKNIIINGNNSYELNLLGLNQAQNASLALCAVEILKEKGIKINNIEKALESVKWSCRFEYFKEKNILIDGCHNPDGAKVLKENLEFYFPDKKRIFVYTNLKNKDYKQFQKNLFGKDDKIYHYDTNDDKFINKNDVKNCDESIDIKGLESLIKNKNKKDLLIICGSLYAIGDILSKIELCS